MAESHVCADELISGEDVGSRQAVMGVNLKMLSVFTASDVGQPHLEVLSKTELS